MDLNVFGALLDLKKTKFILTYALCFFFFFLPYKKAETLLGTPVRTLWKRPTVCLLFLFRQQR